MKMMVNGFLWSFAAIGPFLGSVSLFSVAEGLLSLNISLSLADALEYYREAIQTCFFWFPLIFEGLPPQWYMDLFAVNLLLGHCLIKTAMQHPTGGSAVGSTFRFSTKPIMWEWRIVYLTVPYLITIPYLLIAPALYAVTYYKERQENIRSLQEKQAYRSTARERGVEFYDKWISEMDFEHRRISAFIEIGTTTINSFLRFYAYVGFTVAAALITYLIDALAE